MLLSNALLQLFLGSTLVVTLGMSACLRDRLLTFKSCFFLFCSVLSLGCSTALRGKAQQVFSARMNFL